MNPPRHSRFLSIVMAVALVVLLGLVWTTNLDRESVRFLWFNVEEEDVLDAESHPIPITPEHTAPTIEDKGAFVLERAVTFSNADTGFGVHLEGSGKAIVYERALEVFLDYATLRRNPRYHQEEPVTYISAVELGLATWSDYDNGRWSIVTTSNRIPIKQALTATNEQIGLAGVTFSFPLREGRPIAADWLVLEIIAPTSGSTNGEAYYYAHSVPTLFK